MTVGIAAISEANTNDPKVVLSSDRLVTTHQQSAIEHEHPETKLTEVGGSLNNANLVCIIAGGIQLGEEYRTRLEDTIARFVQQNDEEPWLPTVADLARENYEVLIQDKIDNVVLSSYGLEMEDLSRQHQFKDSFLNDVLAEAEQVEQEIQKNLVILVGGVGLTGPAEVGPAIYEISNSNMRPHNQMGYATIGSGTQPAESEFIQADYSKRENVEDTLATVTAANYKATEARGVGGETDVAIVDATGVETVDEEMVSDLMEIHENIDDEQEEIREKYLSEYDIDWE